jgi:hypothetical protein
MYGYSRPCYALGEIKERIRDGRYWITRRAGIDAGSLSLDEGDIKECVLGLEFRHFFKSMPSRKRPGMNQDVYRCRYAGLALYIKLQMGLDGRAVVVSFKLDESA